MRGIGSSDWATAAPVAEPDGWERLASPKVEVIVFASKRYHGEHRFEVTAPLCFARGWGATKRDAWQQARLIAAAMESFESVTVEK